MRIESWGLEWDYELVGPDSVFFDFGIHRVGGRGLLRSREGKSGRNYVESALRFNKSSSSYEFRGVEPPYMRHNTTTSRQRLDEISGL